MRVGGIGQLTQGERSDTGARRAGDVATSEMFYPIEQDTTCGKGMALYSQRERSDITEPTGNCKDVQKSGVEKGKEIG